MIKLPEGPFVRLIKDLLKVLWLEEEAARRRELEAEKESKETQETDSLPEEDYHYYGPGPYVYWQARAGMTELERKEFDINVNSYQSADSQSSETSQGIHGYTPVCVDGRGKPLSVFDILTELFSVAAALLALGTLVGGLTFLATTSYKLWPFWMARSPSIEPVVIGLVMILVLSFAGGFIFFYVLSRALFKGRMTGFLLTIPISLCGLIMTHTWWHPFPEITQLAYMSGDFFRLLTHYVSDLFSISPAEVFSLTVVSAGWGMLIGLLCSF